MSFENFYTAMSRARNIGLIHLNLKPGIVFKSEYNGNDFRLIKNKNDDGLVYEIEGYLNGIKKWYVGITSRNKNIRLDEHDTNPKSACFNLTDKSIRVIGRVIGDLGKLKQIEKDYIIDCKMMYGTDCINRTNHKILVGNPSLKCLRGRWEVVENTGKIYEYNNQFKLKWNVGDTGDKKEKKWRYGKKGKEVVLEEIKNWCVLNEILI